MTETPVSGTAALQNSPFAISATRYREQGLAVMPCGPGTKFPGTYSSADGWRTAHDWQKYCERLPNERFEFSIWDKWPDAGICLALGTSSAPVGMQLVAIDIDTEEPAEVAAIRACLPGSPVRKRGAKGETEFYLSPTSVPNRPYNNTMVPGTKRRMLDLLGHGRQTVMPPTIHPSTGAPYVWTTLDTLETYDVADLPVLPADIADRLSAALAVFGHEDAPTLGERDPDAEATTHRQLNDAALANLAAWVPALGLYKCRQVGGKYKAVSAWRPSSSGRPLSQRATNLAIGPEGIKDCGEGKGYTPIDLVMAACGADLDSAFRWLQERVAPAEPVRLSARIVDDDEPFVRTSPKGNLAGLRLATVDGAAVEESQPLVTVPEVPLIEVCVEHGGLADELISIIDQTAIDDPNAPLLRQLLQNYKIGIGHAEECDESPEQPVLSADGATIDDFACPPGLVGELIEWMASSHEQPCRALLLGPALTLVATLAGRKFASPTNLRTNNYIVTLAESGFGKDHGIQQIKILTEAAGLDRYIGPARIMSASALRKLIGREPSIACYMDEFGGFMSQIHDKRAGIHNTMIREDLKELFSAAQNFFAGAEYAAEAAVKIYSPNISIAGTSSPDQFWASLTSMSAVDGLLARLIVIEGFNPRIPEQIPSCQRKDVPDSLIKALRRVAEAGGRANLSAGGRAPEPTQVPLSDEASERLAGFKADVKRAILGARVEAKPFLNRVVEHAVKLALTVAVGEQPNEPEISDATMAWGIGLARLSMASLILGSADRIADNERGAAVNSILNHIRKAGAKGITEGRIVDRMRGVDARMRTQILQDLQMAGQVNFVRTSGTGGRASERYVAANFRPSD
jgi:hypothetical protein